MGEGPGGNKMRPEIVAFLEAQGVQDVVDDIDLTWMGAGHIDEVVSFPTTADGRARVASPEAAWALLRIAQAAGEGSQVILRRMNGIPDGGTVDQILSTGYLRHENFAADGYSDKLLEVRAQLGLTSPFSQEPTSGNGAPAGVLRRAGYLDVYDTLFTYGEAIEWKLEFTTERAYKISYQKAGDNDNWIDDGFGHRDYDSLSDSRAVYVLHDWWDASLATAVGHTVTFTTEPSPNMIEVPVLFWHGMHRADLDFPDRPPGAIAVTNNVVNSLVDGNRLLVGHVHGPTVQNDNLFNDYVDQAANLVGFANGATRSEERAYHNGVGSIHCGTNVLREIPAEKWWNVS